MAKRSPRIKPHGRDRRSQSTFKKGDRRKVFRENGSNICKILENNIYIYIYIVGVFRENYLEIHYNIGKGK